MLNHAQITIRKETMKYFRATHPRPTVLFLTISVTILNMLGLPSDIFGLWAGFLFMTMAEHTSHMGIVLSYSQNRSQFGYS